MKKLLGIIVLGLLLSGCNEMDKKYPTKLFGIEMYDDVNNYTFDDKKLTIESGSKREKFDAWLFSKKIKFHKNSSFGYFYLYTNKDLKIIDISSGISISEKKSEFKNKCLKERNQFIKNFSTLYKFSPNKFKNKFFINGQGVEEDPSYTDRKYIIFKSNNKEMVILSSCIYNYENEDGEIFIDQRMTFGIEDREFQIKRMLDDNMVETKKMSNEMIKFDLAGL